MDLEMRQIWTAVESFTGATSTGEGPDTDTEMAVDGSEPCDISRAGWSGSTGEGGLLNGLGTYVVDRNIGSASRPQCSLVLETTASQWQRDGGCGWSLLSCGAEHKPSKRPFRGFS